MKLFIFGATGDLFRKKVSLSLDKMNSLEIFALGRKEMTSEEYMENNLPDASENLKKRITYLQVNFMNHSVICKMCSDYFSRNEINHFYIALPPEKIMETLIYLKKIKEEKYKIKILIEKPFGSSLIDAENIKKIIEENDLENDVYLADHYLFKENILRRKNKGDFKKITMKSLETFGVEGREYYDSVGALKDMVQSHFFNILISIIGKENFKKLHIEDVSVGQYENYEKEIGKDSETETYVKLLLKYDNVEIEIETGKKRKNKESFILLNDEKYLLNEGKDPYIEMIERFLNNDKTIFPTTDDAILTWKLTEKIKDKFGNLEIY